VSAVLLDQLFHSSPNTKISRPVREQQSALISGSRRLPEHVN
jgi:hypothetical protein